MGVVKLADYRPQLEVVEHRVADTEDGFMRVANEITDSLLMADLTVRQLKVMLAIMRKTYGFNKPMDRLTNTQIAAMTGIHHTHVCAAKRQLIERKFLIADGVKIGVNKVVSQWIDPVIPSELHINLLRILGCSRGFFLCDSIQCILKSPANRTDV
jgi:phage replication O-like protein O